MKSYHITKGHHYADGLNFGLHCGSTITRKIQFGASCWYNNVRYDDQINKLFGFSFGFNHHNNSVRFGWRPNNDANLIDIFAYQYNKGVRTHTCIATLPVSKWHEFEIEVKGKAAIYSIDGEYLYACNWNPVRSLFGLKLFPYFGGKRTAPKNMVFRFNRPLR